MFILTLAFATFTAADVMFVAATMALDTIIELTDAFSNVLPANIGRRVLVAAVTGLCLCSTVLECGGGNHS